MRRTIHSSLCLIVLALSFFSINSLANPFAPGWALQPEASTIRFQSVKNNTKVESSTFASLSGDVNADGLATVKILLDSVDTKVDLRNVRMRFLFFETFKFPEAIVTLKLDPEILNELPTARRKIATVSYNLALHGIASDLEAELAFTQISDDLISVTTSAPITLSVADFNLMGGIKKLEEAADVSILPSTNVTFDFLFSRAAQGAASDAVTAGAGTAALETQGDFSVEACKGRFEIMSRTDNIYFNFSSAELDPESRLILDSIADIIRRCPGLVIEVSGHTDSDGGSETNQTLSEARADSVKSYFVSGGIESNRIVTRGYGELKPVVANDSAENKRRNRRIEFTVVGS